jgi:oligopeptide/dipeptide ABC transporter ATP-binding protein
VSAPRPEPLLRVENLRVQFAGEAGPVTVVDGVSFDVEPGQSLGLVGESGCGKSATALSILRLLPPGGRIAGGRILFKGVDLLGLSEEEMRRRRGAEIAMVFQEPASALDPVFTIADQVGESLEVHRRLSRREARRAAIELLERVGIPEPARRADAYPHELSGGMRQRVCIAMALACRPALLLADEPTTALDVTVQAQILALLADLEREFRMSMILISHDLALVGARCDAVAVMYAGRIAERGPAGAVLRRPAHPYARGLLESRPRLDRPLGPRERLAAIPGAVPDPRHWPPGCRFHPRCPIAREECRRAPPPLVPIEPERAAPAAAGAGPPLAHEAACPYSTPAEVPA